MKILLTATSIIEGLAGLMFELQPSQMSVILFSTSLSTPVEFTYARAFGVMLLALGVICWITRKDEQSHTLRGIVSGLLIFEAGIIVVLSYASIVLGLFSVFLWPFILVHLAIAVWCIVCLLKKADQIMEQVN